MQANTSECLQCLSPSHPSSPFSYPKETHKAMNIPRAQLTPSEAQPEQQRGCLPPTSLANPNLWAGNICQDKPVEMTQIASPPPSCSTEQQPSLATGSRTSWRNDSKLLSGVGGGGETNRTENTQSPPPPFSYYINQTHNNCLEVINAIKTKKSSFTAR